MTAREMQIAFERRLALINPSLQNSEKVDSSTIFQLLNTYAQRFVQQSYLNEDSTENDTRIQKTNKDAIGTLLEKQQLTKYSINTSEPYCYSFELPSNYSKYVRSSCTANVQQDWKDATRIIPNELVSDEDISPILTTIHNQIILPHPYVSIRNANGKLALNVITDKYTTIRNVNLTYYRKLKKFDVIGVNNVDILDHCELPDSVHDLIVDGAVEMFITENKYRLTSNSDNKQ